MTASILHPAPQLQNCRIFPDLYVFGAHGYRSAGLRYAKDGMARKRVRKSRKVISRAVSTLLDISRMESWSEFPGRQSVSRWSLSFVFLGRLYALTNNVVRQLALVMWGKFLAFGLR